ncbi:MAG TPA: hypothetical protein VFZ61_02850 [Polyangiales bacterium]
MRADALAEPPTASPSQPEAGPSPAADAGQGGAPGRDVVDAALDAMNIPDAALEAATPEPAIDAGALCADGFPRGDAGLGLTRSPRSRRHLKA